MHRRNVLIFSFITALGLAADQLSKWWVATHLALRSDELEVLPGFLSLVHSRNTGAAFGLLRDFEYRQALFGVFTLVAIGVILDLLRRIPRPDFLLSFALGLIFSGALGNAVDRIRFQYVTDFLRVYTEHPTLKPWLLEHLGAHEWPTFNIADAALVVGVGLFLAHYLFLEEPTENAAEAQRPTAKPQSEQEGARQDGAMHHMSTPSAAARRDASPVHGPTEPGAEQRSLPHSGGRGGPHRRRDQALRSRSTEPGAVEREATPPGAVDAAPESAPEQEVVATGPRTLEDPHTAPPEEPPVDPSPEPQGVEPVTPHADEPNDEDAAPTAPGAPQREHRPSPRTSSPQPSPAVAEDRSATSPGRPTREEVSDEEAATAAGAPDRAAAPTKPTVPDDDSPTTPPGKRRGRG